MRTSKHFLIGLISIAVVWGAVGVVQPPPSHADVQFGGIKKILKLIFPPFGPGTRDQRFVAKGEKVCDNKTGLWWEQSPSTSDFTWANAIQYCENLTLSGKHPRPGVMALPWPLWYYSACPKIAFEMPILILSV